MPLTDMPLQELLAYKGSSPVSADHKEYWQHAIAEMKAIDPRVEIIPAAFQTPLAECFDLYFTGVRGARIHAKYIRPKSAPAPHPALLQFHGYSGNSGDWTDKLSYAALGFSVVSMDTRGQGGGSEDSGGVKGNTLHGHIIRGLDDADADNLLFRHIYLDLPEVDESRVAATGWSQGGGLTIACAALEPRICKAIPVYPFLSDYKRVWDMDLAKDAYDELRTYFRLFDPQHEREAAIFERLGYIDIQYLAERIEAEVLMGIGLADTICPPSTQMAAYNRITAKKKLEVFPDFGHEGLPGLHDKITQFLLSK